MFGLNFGFIAVLTLVFLWILECANGTVRYLRMSSSGQYQLAASCNETFSGEMLLSVDWGNSWRRANAPLNCWASLAINGNGKHMYAGVNGGGVYVSSDYGNSWGLSNAPKENLFDWTALVSDDSGQFVAGSQSSEVFTSADFGATWRASKSSSGKLFTHLACDNSGRYLIASKSSLANVQLSSDYGRTWNASLSLRNGYWSGVYSGTSGNVLSALEGDSLGLYNTHDRGLSWTRAAMLNLPLNYLKGLAMNGSGNFMAGYTDHLYLSYNSGDSWTQVANVSQSHEWSAIAMGDSGQHISAVESSGTIHVSFDYGRNWRPTYNSIEVCPAGYGYNGNECSIICSELSLYNNGSFLFCQNCPSSAVTSVGKACIDHCPPGYGYNAVSQSCNINCDSIGGFNNGSSLNCEPCPAQTVSQGANCSSTCPADYGYEQKSLQCSALCSDDGQFNDGSSFWCVDCPALTVSAGDSCYNPCSFPFVPSGPSVDRHTCQEVNFRTSRGIVVAVVLTIFVLYILCIIVIIVAQPNIISNGELLLTLLVSTFLPALDTLSDVVYVMLQTMYRPSILALSLLFIAHPVASIFYDFCFRPRYSSQCLLPRLFVAPYLVDNLCQFSSLEQQDITNRRTNSMSSFCAVGRFWWRTLIFAAGVLVDTLWMSTMLTLLFFLYSTKLYAFRALSYPWHIIWSGHAPSSLPITHQSFDVNKVGRSEIIRNSSLSFQPTIDAKQIDHIVNGAAITSTGDADDQALLLSNSQESPLSETTSSANDTVVATYNDYSTAVDVQFFHEQTLVTVFIESLPQSLVVLVNAYFLKKLTKVMLATLFTSLFMALNACYRIFYYRCWRGLRLQEIPFALSKLNEKE